MAPRRGWAGLSPGYKRDLARRGVTRQKWVAGGKLPPRAPRPAEYQRLSPGYRQRLSAQGIGREEYLGGYNLRRRPGPPSASQLSGARSRLLAGDDTAADGRLFARWYASKDCPPWLQDQPGLNKAETAVVLAQITRQPEDWCDVLLNPGASGSPWVLSVLFEDDTSQEILIPNHLAQDVIDWMNKETGCDGDPLEWDVGGTL